MNENGSIKNTEYDQSPETSRFSRALPRNPLLNHSATQIGINLAAIRVED
jgi:hypothetical protein